VARQAQLVCRSHIIENRVIDIAKNDLDRVVGSDVEPARANIKQEREHFVPQIERGALHWQSQMRTDGGHQRQSG
jgi:hypothetical protein